MRNKIWYSFVSCKTNEFYSGFVLRYYQWAEWITNTFLVIATSTSVAAWVIWDKFKLVWAIIIGISQLLFLLKPFLLFPKYIKVYSEKNVGYQTLSWELEKLWYKREHGLISASNEYDEFDAIRKRLIEIDRFPEEVIVITHEKALTRAEGRCNHYIDQL